MPSDKGEVVTLKAAAWDYTSENDLTIDGVTLIDPVGLDLVSSALVSSPPNAKGIGIIAVHLGFPPRSASESSQDCDNPVNATGATLKPSEITQVLYVMLRTTTTEEGTTQATQVDYHDSKNKYQLKVPTASRATVGGFFISIGSRIASHTALNRRNALYLIRYRAFRA